MFALLKEVLGKRNYFIIFAVSSIFYGAVFSIMTNIIDIRFGLSNIRIAFTFQSGLLLIVLSFLGGLLISLQVFLFNQKRKNYASTTAGASGMVLSFFAATCPFCKPLLISLLGLSGSIGILRLGFAFAFLSALLLLASICLTLNSISKKSCCQ